MGAAEGEGRRGGGRGLTAVTAGSAPPLAGGEGRGSAGRPGPRSVSGGSFVSPVPPPGRNWPPSGTRRPSGERSRQSPPLPPTPAIAGGRRRARVAVSNRLCLLPKSRPPPAPLLSKTQTIPKPRRLRTFPVFALFPLGRKGGGGLGCGGKPRGCWCFHPDAARSRAGGRLDPPLLHW